jgi:hypothetical protein
MSIVISPLVRLVIAKADTTNFDFGTNEATEISILKEINIERSMSSILSRAETVSSTSNRVASNINVGYSHVNFSVTTYCKPVIDGANITSADKLLWESLSATDTIDNPTTSTISFITGNTNKLRELYFYLIYEDGTYYKISRGVVSSVEIDVDINGIAKNTWNIQALDIDYIGTSNLTGSAKDLRDTTTFIRNKLTTLALGIGGTNYTLAVTKAKVSIINDVKIINRSRVGEIAIPNGHYVGTRLSKIDLSFYLNTQTNGSSTLLSDLMAYTTLDDINTLGSTILSIGGSSSDIKVNISSPTCKLKLVNPTVGLTSTVDISLHPQESTLGLGNDISIFYINETNTVFGPPGVTEHSLWWFGQQLIND